MAGSHGRWDWLLGVLTAAPMAAYATMAAAGTLGQSQEARLVAAAILIGASLLGAVALVIRARHLRSVESRILRARPTQRCGTCGYSSDGLDTERVDTGTLPFDHAMCPECGRPNPR